MKKSWLIVCFINFFIASLMGLLLRLMYVAPVKWVNFPFLMHGHSHTAMLGWVYLMLYGLIVHCFIPEEAQKIYTICGEGHVAMILNRVGFLDAITVLSGGSVTNM